MRNWGIIDTKRTGEMKMAMNLVDLAEAIENLNEEEKKALDILIGTEKSSDSSVATLLAGMRFSEKRVCPFCSGTHVVKNGKRKDGTQKYICRECGRNPLATSNSILCGTHKTLTTWITFIGCELNDESLKQTAEKCGIHINTALGWRHKLHEAVSNSEKEVRLNGEVEIDETYPVVSYKGNHIKNKDFMMPREPHKRGSQVSKRGLSDELLCIPCAVDDEGNVVGRSVKCGAVSYDSLHALYSEDKIADNSIIVTDSCKAYIQLASDLKSELIQIAAGEHSNGSYNIQRVNSFHTSFMTLINGRHRGVSSKHINGYLAWCAFKFKAASAKLKNRVVRLFGDAFSITAKIIGGFDMVPVLV